MREKRRSKERGGRGEREMTSREEKRRSKKKKNRTNIRYIPNCETKDKVITQTLMGVQVI